MAALLDVGICFNRSATVGEERPLATDLREELGERVVVVGGDGGGRAACHGDIRIERAELMLLGSV